MSKCVLTVINGGFFVMAYLPYSPLPDRQGFLLHSVTRFLRP